MKFSKFSEEMVCELLIHLADHEKFASLKDLGVVSKSDVQTTLVELADQLREQAQKQPLMRKSQINPKDLSHSATQVISKLSPKEEDSLFKSFKISEE